MRGAQAAARWQVVDDGEDRDAALADVVEDAEEVELVAHVEVRRRLVEEEDGRLLREPARERRELPLAGGERPERPPGEVLDLRLPQGARHRRPVLRGEGRERAAVRVAAERHPVLDRDAVRRLVLRGHEGHALREARARPARERAALEEDLAPRGREEARERPDECRLAGRVRPDEGEALARQQREVHAPQHVPAAAVDARARGPRARRSPAPLLSPQREEEVGRADERGDGAEGQLDVLPEGTRGEVGHHHEDGARQEGGRQQVAAERPHERAQRVGRDEADERHRPRHRGHRPRHEGAQAEDQDSHAVHGKAERRRLLLAERQDVERPGEEQEGERSGKHERGGEGEVLVAAALEPAGEPEEHGAHAELLDRHEQDRRAGRGQGAHREAGQEEARERGPPAGVGDRVDEEEREEGARARGEGHREEALLRPAQVHGEDRAEGGAGADPEEPGVGQRVAEERLQRGAHHREPPAHERRDEDAREGGPTTG